MFQRTASRAPSFADKVSFAKSFGSCKKDIIDLNFLQFAKLF